MSEIKPVYQLRVRFNLWEDQTKKQYEDSKFGDGVPRILYPAAAYEALENERDELKQSLDDLQERFNGIKFIESELRKENDSLNAEVLRLKNELIASLKDWHDMNANHEALQKENAELKSEYEISAAVIEKCCNLLSQIAITIKGEPKELTCHSYHDLPELVSVLHVENELNKVQMQEMLTAMRRAVLALAFAAETSNAMKDDYNALSAAIAKAVASNNGE